MSKDLQTPQWRFFRRIAISSNYKKAPAEIVELRTAGNLSLFHPFQATGAIHHFKFTCLRCWGTRPTVCLRVRSIVHRILMCQPSLYCYPPPCLDSTSGVLIATVTSTRVSIFLEHFSRCLFLHLFPSSTATYVLHIKRSLLSSHGSIPERLNLRNYIQH